MSSCSTMICSGCSSTDLKKATSLSVTSARSDLRGYNGFHVDAARDSDDEDEALDSDRSNPRIAIKTSQVVCLDSQGDSRTKPTNILQQWVTYVDLCLS